MKLSLPEEIRWTIRRRIIGIGPAYKELYDACMGILGRSDLELRSVFFGSMPEDEEGKLWDPKTKRFHTYIHLAVAVRSLIVERVALNLSGIKVLSGYRGDFPGSVSRIMFRRWRARKLEPLHIHQIPLMNKLIVGSMGLRHGKMTLLRKVALWLYRQNPKAMANAMRIMNRARLFHVRFVFETDPLTKAVQTNRPPVGLIMFVSKNPRLPSSAFDAPAARLTEIFLRNHHNLPHTLAELSESEARYKSLVDMMPIAHCVYRGGRFLYMNPRGLVMLAAKTLDDLNQQPVMNYIHTESRAAFLQRERDLETAPLGTSSPLTEQKLRNKDGEVMNVEAVATKIRYDGFDAIQLAFHDVSPLRMKNEELRFLAFHDPMTALWSRIRYRQLIADNIQQIGAREHGFSVFYVDLDGFKNINDLLGHTEGDDFLKNLAFNLRVKDTDGTLARLGGDEFGFIFRGVRDHEEIHKIGIEILRVVSEPITLSRGDFSVTASIGVAIFPEHGKDPEALMKNADLAAYAAKARGRNNVFIYDESLQDRLQRRLKTESELRCAITGNQFQLVYQPIRAARSGKIASLEALIRWNHPSGRVYPPSEFIALAEETRQITDIGRWVLGEACRQIGELRRAGHADMSIAVNVSPVQLDGGDLFADVMSALRAASLPGTSLELEITEESVVQDPEKTRILIGRLADQGVRTTIDDFGMGRSALSYFKHFPAHGVKIDQSFVRGILEDDKDAAIVRAVIQIGRSLGLVVTAEGIESGEVETWLSEAGCDKLQGYHIGQPMSAQRLLTILN